MDEIQELRRQLGEVTADQIRITKELQEQLAEISRIRAQLLALQGDESEA